MQSQLIDQINSLINRVFAIAAAQGEERPRKIPYRVLQAMILTSPAFFDMSADDAAEAMGIDVDTVYDYAKHAKQNAYIARFVDLWAHRYDAGSLEQPLDVSHVDETFITQTF